MESERITDNDTTLE